VKRKVPERNNTTKGIAADVVRKDKGELLELTRAGIERERVLHLLALAPRDYTSIKTEMRKRQEALRSLSRRLVTVARDTKDVVNDFPSALSFWTFLLGEGHEVPVDLSGRPPGSVDKPFAEGSSAFRDVHFVHFPVPRRVKWPPDRLCDADSTVSSAVTGIYGLAERLRLEARKFGLYLRAFGRVKTGVVMLLVQCWLMRVDTLGGKHLLRRGNRITVSMDCLDQLATLLTYAFEAAGHTKVRFSADSLRMTFKRHATRVILRLLTLQPPI
jgi:hypothetical protein